MKGQKDRMTLEDIAQRQLIKPRVLWKVWDGNSRLAPSERTYTLGQLLTPLCHTCPAADSCVAPPLILVDGLDIGNAPFRYKDIEEEVRSVGTPLTTTPPRLRALENCTETVPPGPQTFRQFRSKFYVPQICPSSISLSDSPRNVVTISNSPRRVNQKFTLLSSDIKRFNLNLTILSS